jgi:hypothetical protein
VSPAAATAQPKKKKNGRKQRPKSSATLLKMLGWTDKPTVPADVVRVLENADVTPGETTHSYLRRDHALGAEIHMHHVEIRFVTGLLRSCQKRNAFLNLDRLAENEEEVARLRERDACQLKEMANKYKVTTTQLGKLLAGDDAFHQAIDAYAEAQAGEVSAAVVDTGAADSTDADVVERLRRRAWAEEAIRLRDDDTLTSGMLKSPNHNLVHANHTRAGAIGEDILQEALKRAGVAFTTDRENAREEFQDDVVALPDVKLNTPLELCGRQIHWIEAKNIACAPSLLPDWQWNKIKRQLDKYTEKFGPGAVLWTRQVLCAAHAEAAPDVLHLTPIHDPPKAKKKPAGRGGFGYAFGGRDRVINFGRSGANDRSPPNYVENGYDPFFQDLYGMGMLGSKAPPLAPAWPLPFAEPSAAGGLGGAAVGGVFAARGMLPQHQRGRVLSASPAVAHDRAGGQSFSMTEEADADVFTSELLRRAREQRRQWGAIGGEAVARSHPPIDSAEVRRLEATLGTETTSGAAMASGGENMPGLASEGSALTPGAIVGDSPAAPRVHIGIQLASGCGLHLELGGEKTLRDLLNKIDEETVGVQLNVLTDQGMVDDRRLLYRFRFALNGRPNLNSSQLDTALADLDLDRVKLRQKPVEYLPAWEFQVSAVDAVMVSLSSATGYATYY